MLTPKQRMYVQAAKALIPRLSDRHPPYVATVSEDSVRYTRKPTGAWVKTWVWVSEEVAVLEQTKEKP